MENPNNQDHWANLADNLGARIPEETTPKDDIEVEPEIELEAEQSPESPTSEEQVPEEEPAESPVAEQPEPPEPEPTSWDDIASTLGVEVPEKDDVPEDAIEETAESLQAQEPVITEQLEEFVEDEAEEEVASETTTAEEPPAMASGWPDLLIQLGVEPSMAPTPRANDDTPGPEEAEEPPLILEETLEEEIVDQIVITPSEPLDDVEIVEDLVIEVDDQVDAEEETKDDPQPFGPDDPLPKNLFGFGSPREEPAPAVETPAQEEFLAEKPASAAGPVEESDDDTLTDNPLHEIQAAATRGSEMELLDFFNVDPSKQMEEEEPTTRYVDDVPEGFIEEKQEDEDEEEPSESKKRRRRRRRRKPQETEEPLAVEADDEASDQQMPAAESDETIEDYVEDFTLYDEEEEVTFRRPPRRRGKADPEEKEQPDPPQKKKRRGRKNAPAAPVAEDDFDADVPEDEEGESTATGRRSHKNIPTWDESVNILITANMESREPNARHTRSKSRPRGRGGRKNK